MAVAVAAAVQAWCAVVVEYTFEQKMSPWKPCGCDAACGLDLPSSVPLVAHAVVHPRSRPRGVLESSHPVSAAIEEEEEEAIEKLPGVVVAPGAGASASEFHVAGLDAASENGAAENRYYLRHLIPLAAVEGHYVDESPDVRETAVAVAAGMAVEQPAAIVAVAVSEAKVLVALRELPPKVVVSGKDLLGLCLLRRRQILPW